MIEKHYLLMCGSLLFSLNVGAGEITYPIVDTGLIRTYDDKSEIIFPQRSSFYFGQDAHYKGNQPSYKNNGDGTVRDNVTGLIWQQNPGEKQTLAQALVNVKKCRLGGYSDWRVPTIKELYSLILFTGLDPNPNSSDTSQLKPFIDTRYFTFSYGNPRKGERVIDSQYGSQTKYVSTTMKGAPSLFGVNFADGRIKGYGMTSPRNRTEKKFYFMYVRGNKNYGKNKFSANRNKTITDKATGLTWMKVDSGAFNAGSAKSGAMNWRQALGWAEELEYGGYDDWRLPNVKELQSVIDYTRSPRTSGSAALSPLFSPTVIKDEGGNKNYPFYWTSSTHLSQRGAQSADYIAVGEALGWMKDRRTGQHRLMDVHGAGAQRSDPKTGDASRYPKGHGPQGDVVRVNNYVLCVRGGKAASVTSGPEVEKQLRINRQLHGNQQSGDGRGRQAFIDRFDKDHDGRVSSSEFDGPSHRFNRLDKDQSGYIESNEVPSRPSRRKR